MSRYSNTSNANWATNVSRLKETFEKWGIGPEDYHITAAADLRSRDSHQYNWEQRKVTVTYRPPSAANVVRMELDSQDTPSKNLNSILITIEAIRMQERRGLSAIAAAHYLALSAPVTARDPFEVLGLRPDAGEGAIQAMYRLKAKGAHPDGADGSDEAMKELNEARDAALERVGAPV